MVQSRLSLVGHMSVTVELDTEREALFHSCLESLVYTVQISRTIECFTNNVLEVKIEFIDSRFHPFVDSTSPSVDFVEQKSMNGFFFIPFNAKLRQSETCSVLLMSDVSSR